MSDWKTIDQLTPDQQEKARALCASDPQTNIADYEFAEFGVKLVRRVAPASVKQAAPTLPTSSSSQSVELEDRIVRLPLSALVPSPLNPRTRYNQTALEELAANLKAVGIVHALLVRPVPRPHEQPQYEVVAGHRRLRAAVLAGLETVPVVVREISDTAALDLMLSENLQREDLNAIEEAQGIQSLLQLRDAQGSPIYSVASVAAKLGRSEQHVLNTLRLLRLPPKAREALEEKLIGASIGYLIARVPDEARRKSLTEEVLRGFGSGPMSKREVLDHIRRSYVVELRNCPFDQTDASLVPEKLEDGERVMGGSCVGCPWATQGEGHVKTRLCTHPACYEAKVTAQVRATKDKALAAGNLVIEGQKARRYVHPDGTPHYESGMVRLDSQPSEGEVTGGRKAPTWKKLLSGEVKPQTIVVIDDRGKAHELVERKLAIEAARKNGYEDLFSARAMRASSPEHADRMQREAEERAKNKLELDTAKAAIGALVGEISKKGVDADGWKAMLELGLFHAGADTEAFVCNRRELKWEKNQYGQPMRNEALRAHGESLGSDRLPAFVVELLLAGWVKSSGVECRGFAALAKVYGLDVKDIKARVKAGIKEEKKQAKKPAKKTQEATEVETVRQRIERLANPRQMTTSALNLLASRVLGKRFEDKPWEQAKGGELNHILEEMEELSQHDPEEGWILEGSKVRCPRCGGRQDQRTFAGLNTVACAPACGYVGRLAESRLTRSTTIAELMKSRGLISLAALDEICSQVCGKEYASCSQEDLPKVIELLEAMPEVPEVRKAKKGRRAKDEAEPGDELGLSDETSETTLRSVLACFEFGDEISSVEIVKRLDLSPLAAQKAMGTLLHLGCVKQGRLVGRMKDGKVVVMPEDAGYAVSSNGEGTL